MYRTASKSMRTWEEPWSTLIRLALYEAWRILDGDHYDPDNGQRFGIDAFDRLSQGQQLYLMVRVGRCLLFRDEPELELHQCVEATAAVLFEVIADELDFECDTPELERYDYRKAVLACYAATWPQSWDSPESDLPLPDCEDRESWRFLIGILKDAFFWDYDYEDEENFTAVPPEAQEVFLEYMAIADDYFVWVPRVPSDEQTAYYGRVLRSLSNGDPQLEFAYQTDPTDVTERGRFDATRPDGRPITLIWYQAADDAGKPLDLHRLRTVDGWDVYRLERARYRIVVTGEELTSNAADAP